MPAAAVIPAPIAYIKVVAVKKLVVEFWNGARGENPLVRTAPVRPEGRALVRAFPPTGGSLLLFVEWEYSPGERVRNLLGGPSSALFPGFRRGRGPPLVEGLFVPRRRGVVKRRFRRSSGSFTLNKLECSKQASTRLDTLAWDNRIGLGFYFRWFLGPK